MLIARPLHLGPLDNNTWVLACDATRAAAVLDAGFEPEAVIAEVRRLGVEVALLLSTHGHYDHLAGMRTVQEAVGGEWWMHPADRFLADSLSEQGALFGFPPAEPPATMRPLADGQRLALGAETLEVLLTPGHSPGSVTFRNGDDLWVGDVLFAGSVGRTDLPGGSSGALVRSIRDRLFPLGDALRVHPGHGPDTTIGRERRSNPFVGEGALR